MGTCAQAFPVQFEFEFTRGFFPMWNRPAEVSQFPGWFSQTPPPIICFVALAIQMFRHHVSACPFLFNADASFDVSHCYGTVRERWATISAGPPISLFRW